MMSADALAAAPSSEALPGTLPTGTRPAPTGSAGHSVAEAGGFAKLARRALGSERRSERMARKAPQATPVASHAKEHRVDSLRPAVDGLFLVLVGNFNPAIFQPAWLGRHNFASEAEVNQAAIELIRPDFVLYNLGPFRFTVQLDRFQAETLRPDHGYRMRDLVCQIFDVLKETPIRQMGINRMMHFGMPSEEEWHKVGHQLVPKAIWEKIMDKPGTLSVSVQGTRPGAVSKRVIIRAEPSSQVKPGVFVQTTEHYEKETDSSTWVSEVLQANWDEAQSFALSAAQQLLKGCFES
jgi:hypothetical protein